jgi:uncharacterized protein (DUF433 family)
MELENRITFNPNQMGGQACIRGLRIPVATVVRCVAGGMTNAEILDAYPDLEADDLRAALQYAASLTEDRVPPARRTAYNTPCPNEQDRRAWSP